MTLSQAGRPMPLVHDWNAPYFGSQTFQLQRCAACQRVIFYPRAICPHCWSDDLRYEEVSPRGTIYSWTVLHRPKTEFFEPNAPYVVAVAELEEGAFLTANLVGLADSATIDFGSEVEVAMVRTGDAWLPHLRLL